MVESMKPSLMGAKAKFADDMPLLRNGRGDRLAELRRFSSRSEVGKFAISGRHRFFIGSAVCGRAASSPSASLSGPGSCTMIAFAEADRPSRLFQ